MRHQDFFGLKGLQKASVSAFTLIEIIIVLAIMGTIYAVAIPDFGFVSSSEEARILGQLNGDFRSAYDLAILTSKNYRFAFEFKSGTYWLETTEEARIYLGDQKASMDPSKEEEDQKRKDFDEEFKKYEDLAGDPVKDPDSDTEITQSSPIIVAKDKLKGPKWSKTEDVEWKNRKLGNNLAFKDISVEHLQGPISIENNGESAFIYLYVLPGYLEKGVIHIGYSKSDGSIDSERDGYTLVTNPTLGEATLESGFKEINVHSTKEEGEF